jgi:hypothetical protein
MFVVVLLEARRGSGSVVVFGPLRQWAANWAAGLMSRFRRSLTIVALAARYDYHFW